MHLFLTINQKPLVIFDKLSWHYRFCGRRKHFSFLIYVFCATHLFVSRHSSNLLPAEDDMAFKDADGSSAAETGESDGKSFKNGTSAMVPADELSESAVEGNPVVDDGVGIRNIPESSYDMCELTVVGNAFLWHQIRCIVAILLLIGEDKESPEVRGGWVCH